jgi:hypothetical protein
MVEGLDIVRIGDCSPVEDPAQPENVLIDHSDWELTGALSLQEAYPFLRPHLAPGPELLGGTRKEMADAEAREGVEASLTLVEPDSITFLSQENPFRQGARQARAIFDIASQGYNLSITDRVVAPLVKGMGDGIYAPEELDFEPDSHIVLTVSLAEPLNGVRYKLVAGVHILP